MPDARGRPPRNNGAAHAPMGRLAVAEGVAIFDDDPMSKVLGLDERTSGPIAWLGYFLGAIALLLGMMVTARAVTVLVEKLDAQTQPAQAAAQEIDVMRDEPPPPPPPPEETAKPEEPPPVVKAAPHEAPPPAPAPAQAAKVLTQEPDPNEPVDLDGQHHRARQRRLVRRRDDERERDQHARRPRAGEPRWRSERYGRADGHGPGRPGPVAARVARRHGVERSVSAGGGHGAD